MVKVIAIGNTTMKDDGIAIKILECIKDELIELDDLEVVYGETDYHYCMELIDKSDIVIILDSMNLGYEPGSVHQVVESNYDLTTIGSQHQFSLVDLLNEERITYYTIGIEIADIDFSFDISAVLKRRFEVICEEVLNKIKKIIKEIHYA